ncbi:hypothetical protein TEA_001012 [Camellia sinensis var. sinensis]|uniref:Amine oxidase domain-containing protein n=1 Tax=Camellia sinensis var. sinensis TaxID=542762 RepID=A0A4S4EWA0_CAMSN|nr:hypothetical protein TEA_001012 [Camellia sinensis var. sinensis]
MSSSLNGRESEMSSGGMVKPVKEKENPKLALEAQLRAAPLLTSSRSSFIWALIVFLMCVFLLLLLVCPGEAAVNNVLLDFLDRVLLLASAPPTASLDIGDFIVAITVSNRSVLQVLSVDKVLESDGNVGVDRSSYDAIVIGSLIGGLVAATQLVVKGASFLVLEKYVIPGGSSGFYKRDGYAFDVGSSNHYLFNQAWLQIGTGSDALFQTHIHHRNQAMTSARQYMDTASSETLNPAAGSSALRPDHTRAGVDRLSMARKKSRHLNHKQSHIWSYRSTNKQDPTPAPPTTSTPAPPSTTCTACCSTCSGSGPSSEQEAKISVAIAVGSESSGTADSSTSADQRGGYIAFTICSRNE